MAWPEGSSELDRWSQQTVPAGDIAAERYALTFLAAATVCNTFAERCSTACARMLLVQVWWPYAAQEGCGRTVVSEDHGHAEGVVAADDLHPAGSEAAQPALLFEGRKEGALALVADEVAEERVRRLSPVRQQRRQRPLHGQRVALGHGHRGDEPAPAHGGVRIRGEGHARGELCSTAWTVTCMVHMHALTSVMMNTAASFRTARCVIGRAMLRLQLLG